MSFNIVEQIWPPTAPPTHVTSLLNLSDQILNLKHNYTRQVSDFMILA